MVIRELVVPHITCINARGHVIYCGTKCGRLIVLVSGKVTDITDFKSEIRYIDSMFISKGVKLYTADNNIYDYPSKELISYSEDFSSPPYAPCHEIKGDCLLVYDHEGDIVEEIDYGQEISAVSFSDPICVGTKNGLLFVGDKEIDLSFYSMKTVVETFEW